MDHETLSETPEYNTVTNKSLIGQRYTWSEKGGMDRIGGPLYNVVAFVPCSFLSGRLGKD